MYTCGLMSHSMHVIIREQLCRVNPLLPHLRRFQATVLAWRHYCLVSHLTNVFRISLLFSFFFSSPTTLPLKDKVSLCSPN